MPKESAKSTITEFTGTGLVRVINDSAGTPTSRNMAPENAIGLLDEDDFATNSATRPPSQQSVAAYTAALYTPLGVFIKPRVNRVLPQLPGAHEATTADQTLNRMVMWAIPCPWPVTISQISIVISTGAASATPRLGLYGVAADGRPGALIVDAGTVDASTSGTKTVTLGSPVDITQGLVYGAVAWQGAVAGLRFQRLGRSGSTGGASGIALPGVLVTASSEYTNLEAVTGVSGALPDPSGALGTPLAGDIPRWFNLTVSALL